MDQANLKSRVRTRTHGSVGGRGLAAPPTRSYLVAMGTGNPRLEEFLKIKNENFPNFKGRLFKDGDHYHADPKIYSKFLTDFADWIIEEVR